MILRGFKEKSKKKYINAALRKRVFIQEPNKIKRVGVLLCHDDGFNEEAFKVLSKVFEISPNEVDVLQFSLEETKNQPFSQSIYYSKDISWNGKIKSSELKRFVDKEFDVLISYYITSSTDLKLLTVASKAKFKIGILQDDERLNDLIIKTELQDLELFKSELIKYLKILKKI